MVQIVGQTKAEKLLLRGSRRRLLSAACNMLTDACIEYPVGLEMLLMKHETIDSRTVSPNRFGIRGTP